MPNPVIVVHGGAGGHRPSGERAAAVDAGLQGALDAGFALIGDGALAAAVAAVRVLEDDVHFNAGHGAVLTAAGGVELDAGVMDGAGRRAGAVAVVRDIPNPVDLAVAVLEDGRHVLLAAEGASQFAAARGIRRCDPAELVAAAPPVPNPGNTVGAVCRDGEGRMAVAVSTGGISGQLPGRVGDSPLCGSGFYADDRAGAVCATGDGEAFVRHAVAVRIVDRLAAGDDAETAAQLVLAGLAELSGEGGVIVVDRDGRIAAHHTSEHMSWAWRDSRGGSGGWSD